jgi:glycosyltransferase
MENELISIIVPIYNVENYLRQCLDSIVSQTYQNFECLLINDGSSDNSADICREYIEKDSRFRYFEKENVGVSSARNLGIERSKGQYITFIDSDDWVDEDYLDVLHRALIDEKADIAISTYKQFNMEDNCYYVHSYQRGYEKRIFEKYQLIEELPVLERYDQSYGLTTGKIISKKALGIIRFNEYTTLCEDMEFWYKLYLFSNKIIYINKDTYNYRKYGNASLKSIDAKNKYSDIQQRLNFISILATNGRNIRGYIENLLIHLEISLDELKNSNQESDASYRWLEETLFLFKVAE